MPRFANLGPTAVVGFMLLTGAFASAQPRRTSEPPSASTSDSTEALIARLNSRVDLVGTELPLDQILKDFEKRHQLRFMFDHESLKTDPPIKVFGESSPRVRYESVSNVRLRSALELVLDKLSLGFVIREGNVLIMKKSTIRRRYYDAPPNAELATDDTDEDDSARNALYPLVHAVFKVESLKDALQQLADSIDATVIVDQVTAADLPIRARLLNVPFDTAVALLASQARMHVVKRDRALYVTTLDDRRVREKLVREMLAVRFSVDGWPLVNVELARVPIRKALSQLSQDSNVPVVVDPAVKFDPEPLITENLGRCPIDLAVELVLEKYAPTLELVKHGQSLLITTKEAAGRRKIRK